MVDGTLRIDHLIRSGSRPALRAPLVHAQIDRVLDDVPLSSKLRRDVHARVGDDEGLFVPRTSMTKQ